MTACSYNLKKYNCFIEHYFSLKLCWIFSFKIDCIFLEPDLDPDPNWAKILDPDPNSMYLDPQHCLEQVGDKGIFCWFISCNRYVQEWRIIRGGPGVKSFSLQWTVHHHYNYKDLKILFIIEVFRVNYENLAEKIVFSLTWIPTLFNVQKVRLVYSCILLELKFSPLMFLPTRTTRTCFCGVLYTRKYFYRCTL